jgi:hypothetical protein
LGWPKQRSKNHAIKKASEKAEADPEAGARAGVVLRTVIARMAIARMVIEVTVAGATGAAAVGIAAGLTVRRRSISKS